MNLNVWSWIAGGFGLALLSSGHCAGMCGPLSFLLSSRNSETGHSFRERFFVQVQMGLGKAFTYSLIGLAFGLAGTLLTDWSRWMGIVHWFPKIPGIFLILTGGSLLGLWPQWALGIKRFETRLLFLLRNTFSKGNSSDGFLVGMLWGGLPCPMVLAPALVAAVSGGVTGTEGAVKGFFMMFGFGLGTLPVLSGSGFLGSFFSGLKVWSPRLTGSFYLLIGVLTFFLPLTHHCH